MSSITLVEQGNNRLRYLLVYDGESALAAITTTGAASPDLNTDSLYGPIKVISLAFVNGLGILPAGAMTQAQARAMWLADSSDTVLGNSMVPRALCKITPRTGSAQWRIDANVDGSGHPTITPVATAAASAYLDVMTQGGIGI
jgi:hypothetical protein